MITKDGVLYSSYSQLDLYERCPYQWYLKYIEGDRTAIVSKYLEYGSAIHETLEELFKMLCNGEKPELQEITRRYHHYIKIHEIPFDSYEEEMEYVMEGLLMLERLYEPKNELEKLMMTSKIIGVEKEFKVNVDGVDIIGFIDLVLRTDDGIVLVDHKSGKSLFDKTKLQTNLQFPIYAMAMKNEYDELPYKCFYNFTKLHKFQEKLLTANDVHEAEVRIKKLFKKMGKPKDRKPEHKPKPSYLCYWCDYGLYNTSICTYSSGWKPKTHKG